MGLTSPFPIALPPGLNATNYCLAALVDGDMLDGDLLLATGAM